MWMDDVWDNVNVIGRKRGARSICSESSSSSSSTGTALAQHCAALHCTGSSLRLAALGGSVPSLAYLQQVRGYLGGTVSSVSECANPKLKPLLGLAPPPPTCIPSCPPTRHRFLHQRSTAVMPPPSHTAPVTVTVTAGGGHPPREPAPACQGQCQCRY